MKLEITKEKPAHFWKRQQITSSAQKSPKMLVVIFQNEFFSQQGQLKKLLLLIFLVEIFFTNSHLSSWTYIPLIQILEHTDIM